MTSEFQQGYVPGRIGTSEQEQIEPSACLKVMHVRWGSEVVVVAEEESTK
jgi:hypothetical protein